MIAEFHPTRVFVVCSRLPVRRATYQCRTALYFFYPITYKGCRNGDRAVSSQAPIAGVHPLKMI